jgi:DNA uptake protein ComE-like DNA-binding protein
MLCGRHSATHVSLAILLLTLAPFPLAYAKKKPPAHPINIHTANSSDLQQVPGIGPSAAQKVLDTRKSYGTFKRADDLLTIKASAPKNSEKCANI